MAKQKTVQTVSEYSLADACQACQSL